MDNTTSRPFPAAVVQEKSPFELVINRGSLDGVREGNTFVVYYVEPEDLIDPETQESLGKLEVVRGTGVATNVQEKMTTIKSNRYENNSGTIIRRNNSPFGGISALIGGETIEQPAKDLIPFDEAKRGDKVKKY
ncbi:hypothetical protein [Psychrobacter sp. APC 3350]|uniref:hypothetical protein n=1 Tax=Psychrobacter sp. APC 3350 TaxID=3035195 RepID=UPI0025B3F9F5|nr:hypothetical protein [Psychrobacter sp. APC 3350]MDN3454610.1 hypothetical protein [Psychrobacter sp. APC 3350]